ncbi:MAG: haloalkane dehalogenase [Spirochaetia bacterium]|nr:haloalkane dehalogenase [Spirochaetia bacterium]
MRAQRTPDEMFQDLPGYPFAPHYTDTGGLRMHYVDEGSGPVVLLLHGEPSWSFLYRKMIPVLVSAGFRAVAPDLIGFGKSDKPVDADDYTYQAHMDWMTAFLTGMDLKDVTLFCQDWGGLLGLRLAAENPERFSRIAAANTFLPTGDTPAGEDFLKWREFSQKTPRFSVGSIISKGCVHPLDPAVLKGYNAPFPDDSYKMGARRFPALVPVTPDDPAAPANRRAWERLREWKKPFLTLFSDSDPITRGGDVMFRRLVPGTKHQPHETIVGAGHFLQEDKGPEIAEKLARWMAAAPYTA